MKIADVFLPLSAMMCLLCPRGFAAEYNWEMDLGLYAQYLENPELKSQGGNTYDAGQIALNLLWHRATEIRKTKVAINGAQARNSDDQAPENNRDFIDFDHQEMGERSLLKLHGSYENTTTFAQALISGNRADVDLEQHNWSLDQTFQYALSQRLIASVGAVQMATTFDQPGTTLSSDFSNRQFTSSVFYTHSDRKSFGINIYQDTLTRAEGSLTSETNGIGFNYHYSVSETLTAKSRLGYRSTMSQLRVFDEIIEERNNGRSLNLDVKKTYERSQLGILFTDDLSPKFNGDLDKTKTAELSFGYRLSETLVASSKLIYIERDPINRYYSEQKIEYSAVSVALGWTPYRPLTLEANYRHINQALPALSVDVNSNALTLGMRWKIHP